MIKERNWKSSIDSESTHQSSIDLWMQTTVFHNEIVEEHWKWGILVEEWRHWVQAVSDYEYETLHPTNPIGIFCSRGVIKSTDWILREKNS